MAAAASGELVDWKRSQEIVWEKHNGSSFHADRFKRIHELAVHFYRGDWASVYKCPQFTNDATARTVRRRARPTHTGDIGDANFRSEDGGPRLMRSVIFAKSCHGYAVHPTQKPLKILAPLLEYSCPPGGTVVDPFMGSGSTLILAAQTGRRAVGIDNQERNCELATIRLSQGSLDLFTEVA